MSKERNPEELAQYLDALYQSSAMPPSEAIDDPMIDIAVKLSTIEPPKLSADARRRILEKVQDAHASTHGQVTPQPNRLIHFPMQSLLRWVAVFAVFIVLMNNVAVPAMADSLPGELLYPIKRTIESIELDLATSDSHRAEVYLTHAERRLQEADKMVDSGQLTNQLTSTIDNIHQAKQLASGDENIQSRIQVITGQLGTTIELMKEHNPDSAHELTSAYSSILPTPEATTVVQMDDAQPSDMTALMPTKLPTATATHTPQPTATDTPTITATIVPSITHTVEPSPTHTALPTATPVYDNYIGVVSATAFVNVRALPSTDSDIIQQIAPGTIVTVIGESLDGKWLQIEFEDGQRAWIAASLIVEGTKPQFTLADESTQIEPTALATETSRGQPETSADSDDNSAYNQGNDGINKFGCDGQGNSCNAGDQGNNGNGGNGNNGKNKGKK